MKFMPCILVVALVSMSVSGCETMRQSSGRSHPNLRSGAEVDPRPESEQLRSSARGALKTSKISAVLAVGLGAGYYLSGTDDAARNGNWAFGAAVTGLAAVIGLYVSAGKTIAAQEAAQRELEASIEQFAREQTPKQ